MRVDAELDSETRQATLTLAFAEETALLPGTFIQVEIDGQIISNAHFVPEQSILEDRTIWVVEGGTLAAREPRLLFQENGFVVTEAFDFGDGIVTSPLLDPLAGSAVTIVGAPEADTPSQTPKRTRNE